MNYESRHETLASIPNEEARGWKRITLASLPISKTSARGRFCKKNCPEIRYSDDFFNWFYNKLPESTAYLNHKGKYTPETAKEWFSTWDIEEKHKEVHDYHVYQNMIDTSNDSKSKPVTLYRGIDADIPKNSSFLEDIDLDQIFSRPVGNHWSRNITVTRDYGNLIIEAEVLPKRINTHTELYGGPCSWEKDRTPCACGVDEHEEIFGPDWDETIVRSDAPINVKALHLNGVRYPIERSVTARAIKSYEQYDQNKHPSEWQSHYADAYATAASLLYEGDNPPKGFIEGMYLVGSRVKGTAREDSDYDWLVVGPGYDKKFRWGHAENGNDFIFTDKHPDAHEPTIRFFPNSYEWFSPERQAAAKLRPEDAEAVERAMGEVAHKNGWQSEPTPYQDQSEIVHTFDNGWTIREPMFNGDAFREGQLMSNCLSDDGNFLSQIERDNRSWPEDAQDLNTPYMRSPHAELRYLSLRDENNLPHATFNWQDGLLIAALGRHNSELKPEYHKMIRDFAHQQHNEFEEYRLFEDERPTDLIAKHTADRSCCEGTSKVAAESTPEEHEDDNDSLEEEQEVSAEQQQQMKALQQSHVFNHMVHIHKVDPEAAAELFFQSPVLLGQEHEREHMEGLIDNHLPETLIVAKVAAETKTQLLRKAEELPKDQSTILHTFDDGWTIRQPATVGDHWREGELMSNCAKNGIYDNMANNPSDWLTDCFLCNKDINDCKCNKSEIFDDIYLGLSNDEFDKKVIEDYAFRNSNEPVQSQYLSLRDPDNLPHVTIGLGEMLGKHNSGVDKKYDKYLGVLNNLDEKTAAEATKKTAAETKKQLLNKAKELPEDTSAILHTFDDGWTIRRPITTADHWRESQLMSNCAYNAIFEPMAAWPKKWLDDGLDGCPLCNKKIKRCSCDSDDLYDYLNELLFGNLQRFEGTAGDFALKNPKMDASNGEITYYSLRDPDNIPHVTIGGTNWDELGRHNSPVKDEYKKYLDDMPGDELDWRWENGDYEMPGKPKKTACSCGSTSFRRVIDPLRTYAKGSKDVYDLECRECYKLASENKDMEYWLGPLVGDRTDIHYEPNGEYRTPKYIFRSMSEEHFQNSLQQGIHQSDERNNYKGQKAKDPAWWKDIDADDEGTVGSRWPILFGLWNSPDGFGRVVKIEINPEDEWEQHPDDDEGVYMRTFKPVPTNSFVGWTPLMQREGYGFSFVDEDGKRHIASDSQIRTASQDDWQYRLNCQQDAHDLYALAPDDTIVGHLKWWDDRNNSYSDETDAHVIQLETHPNHQNKGIATNLWNVARQHTPHLLHSFDTTPAADGWINSLPADQQGRSESVTIDLDPDYVSPVGTKYNPNKYDIDPINDPVEKGWECALTLKDDEDDEDDF